LIEYSLQRGIIILFGLTAGVVLFRDKANDMGDRQAMKIESIRFSDRQVDLDLRQLQALFNQSAFWAIDRQLEDLQIAIDRSEPVISAWDDDKLIGFARANSDGIYRAMIFDVVVDPDYRQFGLGRKLVETILGHACIQRVEKIYLITTNQQSFYERLGFLPNGSTTMILDRGDRG
jgi:N-acetylglutamate synthase-like GNAT family acetyltransferase